MQAATKHIIYMLLLLLNTINASNALGTPYMVAIKKDEELLCGGSIISQNFVLTAAHCLRNSFRNTTLFVLAGSNTLDETKMQRYKVTYFMTHSSWQIGKSHDIALLFVRIGFLLDGQNVDKIAVDMDKPLPYLSKLVLISWGEPKTKIIKPNHKAVASPIEAEVTRFNTISNDQCGLRGFKFVQNFDICGVTKDARGECQVKYIYNLDSGGPVLNKDLNLQVGIASYGISKCTNGSIYMFTRLEPLKEWIKREIRSVYSRERIDFDPIFMGW